MKKLTGILLALTLLLSLCITCLAEPVKADSQQATQQIQTFIANWTQFQQNGTQGKWYYTVTDLDHNGTIELIAAAADEANNTKALRAWTCSKEDQTIVPCTTVFPEGMANPGIVTEKAKTFYDTAADQWTYLFTTDLALAEQDVYSFRCSLSLQGTDLQYNVLPTEHRQMIQGIPVISYLDQTGNVIGSEGTGGSSLDSIPGTPGEDASFYWVDSAVMTDLAVFFDSYSVFAGDKQMTELQQVASTYQSSTSVPSTPVYTTAPEYSSTPVYTAAPVWTPAPTLSQDATHDPMYDELFASGQAPVWTTPAPEAGQPAPQTTPYLTSDPLYGDLHGPSSYYIPTPAPTQHIDLYVVRNPTDENRKPGSTANFVANANVRDTLKWVFVSPGGSTYSASEFAGMFPDSPLSGVYEGVVSISNVTADMDGWGAYCIFYYEDQTATSGTGYIHIY